MQNGPQDHGHPSSAERRTNSVLKGWQKRYFLDHPEGFSGEADDGGDLLKFVGHQCNVSRLDGHIGPNAPCNAMSAAARAGHR